MHVFVRDASKKVTSGIYDKGNQIAKQKSYIKVVDVFTISSPDPAIRLNKVMAGGAGCIVMFGMTPDARIPCKTRQSHYYVVWYSNTDIQCHYVRSRDAR